jgi:hypothetical protein
MKQSKLKKRLSLTSPDADHRLSLHARPFLEFAAQRQSNSSFRINGIHVQSRNVYALQPLQRLAGVFPGLNSEAFSGSRQPTRQKARWVFSFLAEFENP